MGILTYQLIVYEKRLQSQFYRFRAYMLDSLKKTRPKTLSEDEREDVLYTAYREAYYRK